MPIKSVAYKCNVPQIVRFYPREYKKAKKVCLIFGSRLSYIKRTQIHRRVKMMDTVFAVVSGNIITFLIGGLAWIKANEDRGVYKKDRARSRMRFFKATHRRYKRL